MSELPEVEITRRDLDKELQGKKIKTVEVVGTKKAIPAASSKKWFSDKLEGRIVRTVARRGVILVLDIGDGQDLVVDLGTYGHFRRTRPSQGAIEHTKVILTVPGRGYTQIRLIDQSSTATMRVVVRERFAALYFDESELGFDPIDDPMPWGDFGRMLAADSRTLKTILTDSKFVVGIGPVYSDEILHAALLRHDRPSNGLNTQEVRRLYRAIFETMHNAVKYRGLSLGGRTDLYGDPGRFDELIEVYGRGGERSRHGRGNVLTARVKGMTHYYCDYQV
ncbi:MAG TPA: hypothetical protein DEP66_05530 [Acidimicrobiaceae bacterium]|nr:hypothetical protein [Acidimicrobiaceae bacterium]HCB37655.1 hypothetical protein [Acidimicrobiaceae bacterium]